LKKSPILQKKIGLSTGYDSDENIAVSPLKSNNNVNQQENKKHQDLTMRSDSPDPLSSDERPKKFKLKANRMIQNEESEDEDVLMDDLDKKETKNKKEGTISNYFLKETTIFPVSSSLADLKASNTSSNGNTLLTFGVKTPFSTITLILSKSK